MASYNKPIIIQKLNEQTEKWDQYYFTHANVNKTTGKEYNAASTNISFSTYSFKIRFCEKLKEVIYNTEIYRILYDGKLFNIENADRYAENVTEITLIGNFNGQKYIN